MSKLKYLLVLVVIVYAPRVTGQSSASSFPVTGLFISAPSHDGVDRFIAFIGKEVAPRHVNTLVLAIDYRFQFKSYPNLGDPDGISTDDARRIAATCKAKGIRVIPHINLLGHQSWHSHVNALLREYPEFDETPEVKMPEDYVWPNEDGLYCKSYCPLHPEVHKVIFAAIDELCEAFDATAFHAGMDEVFYIAEDQCVRCHGLDPAVVFADEVRRIHDHLFSGGRTLWMWGDRLLDGQTTGLGMWEASYNNTFGAIDLIPKDVVICDWHYERADKTAVYFAMKGFKVITCPWRTPEITVRQVDDMRSFIQSATTETRARFLGVMQTNWSDFIAFESGLKEDRKDNDGGDHTPWASFKAMTNRAMASE